MVVWKKNLIKDMLLWRGNINTKEWICWINFFWSPIYLLFDSLSFATFFFNLFYQITYYLPIVLILFSNFKSVLFAIAKELSRGTGQPPLDNGPQIITPWTIAHRTITPRAIGALCQLPPGQLPHGKLTPVLIPSRSVASFHSVAHP